MFEHLICVELSSIDCKIECLIATSDSALHESFNSTLYPDFDDTLLLSSNSSA